ncbi:KH domain-containing protein [Helicobacter aurati]|uniref:KH domain-containing protein n=1 Tax=Helicobacter aurati TaxID=137778 RepID=A0A3D8J3K0_9HELI|nr:KH domain-containing protein [Helicobacter aurati]RDU71331.1 KH domain-containing protein [Helicobacter aurati]
MHNTSVEKFLEIYLKKIVKYPEHIAIKRELGKKSDYMLCIEAAEKDVGKIIGKDGKMISALKNVIAAVKAKDNVSYELIVIPKEI